MLYIFDLGNVIVDIDFNRVLGVWSDLSRVPLANLKQSFTMGEAFQQHERGEISDEDFAEASCVKRWKSPLSYRAIRHRLAGGVCRAAPGNAGDHAPAARAGATAWWFCRTPTACIATTGRSTIPKCSRRCRSYLSVAGYRHAQARSALSINTYWMH